MGINIGGVNVAESIVSLEHRINYLENLIQFVLDNNPDLNLPKKLDIENFRADSVAKLKGKYPNMGINLKKH